MILLKTNDFKMTGNLMADLIEVLALYFENSVAFEMPQIYKDELGSEFIFLDKIVTSEGEEDLVETLRNSQKLSKLQILFSELDRNGYIEKYKITQQGFNPQLDFLTGIRTEEVFNPRSVRVIIDTKEEVNLYINKGNASTDLIADILSDISLLNKIDGGAGISFELNRIYSSDKVEA